MEHGLVKCREHIERCEVVNHRKLVKHRERVKQIERVNHRARGRVK
jgi:hypothetical protein